MNNFHPYDISCPLFLFDPERRRGQLQNPVTGMVELEFPQQLDRCSSYSLHTDSELSPEFASYLYYLVNEHILFTKLTNNILAIVDAEEARGEEPPNEQDHCDQFEFSTVWFRSTLNFMELSGIYDCLGFCFLDGALYKALYCEVVEVGLFLTAPLSLSQPECGMLSC